MLVHMKNALSLFLRITATEERNHTRSECNSKAEKKEP